MLKYSTAVNNEDGLVSPTHRNELDYMRNTLQVSAGSKTGTKMAIKKRGIAKRSISRDRAPESSHLPPISQPNSPQNGMITSSMTSDKREALNQNQPLKRKEIRTPYVQHINRVSDVPTPYVLHANFSNIEPPGIMGREHSKLSSSNVLELRREPELRHEATFSSLQKYPSANSPRPKGRHGRQKHSSFNEIDMDRSGDLKELTIQSNQIGLNKRVERKREPSRGRGDESFSIRKKIEQFRKWHEEQYREKIKKLKKEVDDQFEAENTRLSRHVGAKRDTPTSKNDLMTPEDKVDLVPSEVSLEKMDEDKITPNLSSTNDTSKPRTESGRTWHTWRNVNDSYAYNDVHKYIKENELMDDEKANWIKKWIVEVNKAMKEIHHESIL